MKRSKETLILSSSLMHFTDRRYMAYNIIKYYCKNRLCLTFKILQSVHTLHCSLTDMAHPEDYVHIYRQLGPNKMRARSSSAFFICVEAATPRQQHVVVAQSTVESARMKFPPIVSLNTHTRICAHAHT